MLWQSDVAHWQAGGLGHSTHFNVTTTAMAPRQLLSQPHCRDGPGARSWAECGAAAHARCVAPTLDHFGANSGQKRPGIRPASLGHGAPRERQRHRSVRRTKTAYFSHCVCVVRTYLCVLRRDCHRPCRVGEAQLLLWRRGLWLLLSWLLPCLLSLLVAAAAPLPPRQLQFVCLRRICAL